MNRHWKGSTLAILGHSRTRYHRISQAEDKPLLKASFSPLHTCLFTRNGGVRLIHGKLLEVQCFSQLTVLSLMNELLFHLSHGCRAHAHICDSAAFSACCSPPFQPPSLLPTVGSSLITRHWLKAQDNHRLHLTALLLVASELSRRREMSP